MRKLIITCALLTSVSFVSSAQTTEVKMQPAATTDQTVTKPNPAIRQLSEAELNATAQTAEKNTKALQAKLGLSKEQYEAVRKAEYRYQSVSNRYLDEGHPVPNGLLSNITSERDANIKNVLTAEQVQKYQAMSK